MDERLLDVLERISMDLQRIADILYSYYQDDSNRCSYKEGVNKVCVEKAGHRGLHSIADRGRLF